jgi:putative membrane protein (TIGR04086 family)
MTALDSSAILRGVSRSLIGIVPAIVMLLVLGDKDNYGTEQSNWVYLALVLIVLGFIIGGAVAGRSAPEAPFMHGAAAAFIAWGVPQIISVIVNMAQDDGVNIVGLFFNGLLAASIGVVGAGIGIRRGTLDDGGGEPTG